jgi:hypothetical protein
MVRRLLVTANVVSISRIFVMEKLRSSETSVLKRATSRNIPEGGILLSGVFISVPFHDSLQ